MTDIMKQRLIGSFLMLLALTIIAIYLMQSAHQSQSVDNVITEAESTPLTVVEYSETEDLIEAKLETTATIDTITMSEPVDEPIPEEEKLVDTSQPAWLIQLASFSVEKNAQSLLSRVNKLGYKANIDSVKTKNGQLYRLRIGPEYERDRVDKMVKDLSEKLKLKPQVIRNN